MSSKVLNCAAFRGNNPLTGEIIWNHRVSGGSEASKEKLKSLYLWDGSSNIAIIAAKLKDEKIFTCSADPRGQNGGWLFLSRPRRGQHPPDTGDRSGPGIGKTLEKVSVSTIFA